MKYTITILILFMFSCKTQFPTQRIYYWDNNYTSISEGTLIGYTKEEEYIILTPDSFRMHLHDSLILK